MKSFTDALSLLLIVMLTCLHVFPEAAGRNYGNLLSTIERGFHSTYRPLTPTMKGPE